MSEKNEFVIEDGVLVKYKGSGSSVTIPEGVTSIGAHAFFNYFNLTSITIPESVTIIESAAFAHCSNMVSISIPKSVAEIGSSAFAGCNSLISVIIPEGVDEISSSTFAYCPKLISVILPKSLVRINYGAFKDCRSLASINIPENLAEIGDSAFKNCSELTSINIPISVTAIGREAFYNCGDLKNISIPQSVSSIGYGAFEGCKSLSQITIPNGVSEIEPRTFCKCSALNEMTIPVGVTSIGESAFEQCASLTKVTIPESVSKIGKAAFHGCASLSSITVLSDDVSIWKNALAYSETPVVLYKKNYQTTVSLPSFLVDYPAQDHLTDLDLAYVLVYQNSKWMNWLYESSKRPYSIIEKALVLFNEMNKVLQKDAKRLMEYTLHHAGTLDKPTVLAVVDFLQKAAPKLAKELENNIEIRLRLGDSAEMLNDEAWALSVEPNEHVASVVKKGIPYANKSGVCPPNVIIGLISSYAELYTASLPTTWGRETHHVLTSKSSLHHIQSADILAGKLKKEDFRKLLFAQSSTKNYRAFLLALTRFCSESQVLSLISTLKSKARQSELNRLWAENMKHALILSDTKAAAEFYEQIGELSKYMKIRGGSDVVYRDTNLLKEFPFDNQGVIKFDVGGDNCIELTITSDLRLRLFDVQKQKKVSRFPVSSDHEHLLNASALRYQELSKEITQFIKDRARILKRMYLEESVLPRELFLGKYLKHPILKHFSRLLIWMDQTNQSFAIDAQFSPVIVRDEPYQPQGDIRLAHVFDLSADKIRAWQKYLAERKEKQLFPQVWEPIFVKQGDYSSIFKDYKGMELSQAERNTLKRRLKESGVEVWADAMGRKFSTRSYSYTFDNHGKLNLGQRIKVDYTFDPDTKTTTFGSFGIYDEIPRRELNAIVFELDRIRLGHAARTNQDAMFTPALLASLTLLQLSELIQTAIKHQSFACTALLMNYKNEHFSDFEMMEFTLD